MTRIVPVVLSGGSGTRLWPLSRAGFPKQFLVLSGDAELGEMMALNYRVAKLDGRQRAMLDFAWKLTTTPNLVDEGDRGGLREVGLSEEDIFDLSETTAFFNLSNRMASTTDMMPNAEYHRADRGAAFVPPVAKKKKG